MMLHIFRRRAAALVLAAFMAVLALPGAAIAHAELKTPTPANKAKLTEPVTVVSGTFTQRVKADGSRLVVKLVGGATVAEGGVDPGDVRKMVAVPATPLGTGSYRVEWTTISLDDGELARGTWTFTVAIAATPSPTPAPSAAPTAAPTAAPSVTPSPSVAPTPAPVTAPPSAAPTPVPSADGSPTGSSGDVVLPIIVALIMLGAGAAYLFSRRGQRPTDTT